MRIDMHRRQHATDGKNWRVWFKDSLGTQGINLDCYADALAMKSALEDLDYLLRANTA